MLRKTFFVEKSKVLDIIQRNDVVKVEISKSDNKGLKNPKICKVMVYFQTDFLALCNFIGHCKFVKEKYPKQANIGLLTGIATSKGNGFIRESIVLKLKSFEDKSGINLNIPKELLSFQNIKL